MAKDNPYSFLHVKKPEIDLPESTDPYSEIVYQKGRQNLNKFIGNGWLQQDTASRFYIYSQQMEGLTQYGLMCQSSIVDYEQNKIKKHEKTLLHKEQDRTMLTDKLSANVGPVFLTYKSSENRSIKDRITSITTLAQADTHVTKFMDQTQKPVEHRIWKVDPSENDFFTSEFKKV